MVRKVSRRSFLLEVGGGAALVPAAAASLARSSPLPAAAAASFARSSTRPAAASPDESYWQMIRRQFAFSEEKIPLNAANLCPSPRVVAERVAELTRDIDVDCSFDNRAKFRQLREDARNLLAEQLGVTADEIALVRNTSEGNNTVNNGLSHQAGDEVILWDQNHPTNNVAWDVRAARFDLTIKRVSTPQNPTGIDELVGVFEKAFSPRTRVLSITHVSNVSGIRLPARELCEVAHRRGIYVHLDGAQTWGALSFNLSEIGCDSYAASSHKWFMGPKEAGVLYVKKDRIGEIWPNVVAPGWGSGAETTLVGARKFESLGQRDDACLAAVGTAAQFHRSIGYDHVESRVLELAGALKSGLVDAGAKLVTPAEPNLSGGVCIMEVPRENRREISSRLYEEHGIACATVGGLRLCPHVYNTMEHIERTVSAIRGMRSLLG